MARASVWVRCAALVCLPPACLLFLRGAESGQKADRLTVTAGHSHTVIGFDSHSGNEGLLRTITSGPFEMTGTSVQLSLQTFWAWVAFFVVEGFRVFLEPLLCHLRILTPGLGDATYGRASLPRSEKEERLIYQNAKVTAVTRTVQLKGEAMRKGGSWDRPGLNFVSYATWQVDEAMEREKLEADVVLLHGINNYAGRQAEMGLYLCQQGFRVIAIDLPSFGRSSGLHCYLPSLRILVEAVHSVLVDIMKHDPPNMAGRKVFLQGESMGGFTALYYAALYPPLPASAQVGETMNKLARENSNAIATMRPNLAGVACAAPMLRISPQSRPSATAEKVARVIAFFAGRLPFAPGVKGNVSDDIRVEVEFHQDPQTYKGWIRISTGLAILAGMSELWQLAPQITVPVSLHVSVKTSYGLFFRFTDIFL